MASYIKCYRDFSGGLSEAANDHMADNQLRAAKNIMPGDGFGIARAFGTEHAFPQLPEPDFNQRAEAIVELTLADGSIQTLAFVSYPAAHQKLCRLAADGSAWQDLVVDIARMRSYFIHANKLYWLTGTAIKCYDGTAINDLSVSPAGESATAEEVALWNRVKRAVAVEQRGQRWFYATPENEVIFSEIGDPAAVRLSNIIHINPRDDDTITALQEFSGGLLIFKRRSVHFLTGWDFAGGSDIVLLRLNVTSGTAFPRTVRLMENAVLYLGMNGVYRLHAPSYSGEVSTEHLSLNRISEALSAAGTLDDAFAEVWENTYFLSIRSRDTGDTHEYRYFPQHDAFFGEYTQRASCYALLHDGRLYLGLFYGYFAVYDKQSRHYISDIDGSEVAIPILAVTKGFDVAGNMAQDVRLRRLLLAARQYAESASHLTLRVKTDAADLQYVLSLLDTAESLTYGEGDLGETFWGWQDTVTKQLEIKRRGKRISFYLSDETIDEPLLIYGLALLYQRRRPRGETAGVSRQLVDYTQEGGSA